MPTILLRLTLENSGGLHARPSARLTKCAGGFASEVTATRHGRTVNAKSIMGVMMLVAGCGSEVEFTIDGADAEACSVALRELVMFGFFPMDAHRTLENYIKASKDRSADSLAKVAFANNDLRFWYTKTSPNSSARELALALSGWAAQQWPQHASKQDGSDFKDTNSGEDAEDTEDTDDSNEPGPNRIRFIELVTTILERLPR